MVDPNAVKSVRPGYCHRTPSMKKQSLLLCLAAAGLGCTGGPLRAAISVAPGDLVLGLFQLNSAGTGVTANTYAFNLGPASTYREGGVAPSVLGNIGADLSAACTPFSPLIKVCNRVI